mmetsp:Transcript_1887/g.5358  ORF Transcript_1887/g.5358 Transcript_1887/m.5358 type:complete len:676 (+) Transcript_1887:77-2104(+)
MKMAVALLLLSLAAAPVATGSPVSKVIEMLSDLQAKVVAEGEESHSVFATFSEWCEDEARQLGFQIKTSQGEVASLKATIEKEASSIAAYETKIEELAAELALDEADLKAATEIRAKEQSDFAAEEAELSDVVGTLERAIGILEKEMAKGAGASMLQMAGEGGVVGALRAMVQASLLSTADEKKLAALVQGSQQAGHGEDDEDLGAPDADVYQGHSGGIIDVLGDLLDKAKSQLDSLRKEETSSKNNFETLKQSLTDEIKFGNSDLSEAKKGIAQSGQAKANAEGDLEVTSKELAEDREVKGDLKANCLLKAQDFEAETKSRGEELKALATAKKAIEEATAGAEEQSYSLFQTAAEASSTGSEVVRAVRRLAESYNSSSLAQLAMQVASTVRVTESSGEDPFAKVKGLITDMIETLEKEAAADAEHKAFCDKELGENEAKEQDKLAEIEKQTTKIDGWTASAAKLKAEVAALQKALADLASSQKEMDTIREKEKALYEKNKPEMEIGLEGVKTALKVLRDYYASDDKAHSSADGAAAGIVGLLEVCESDFSKNLAEIISTEEAAVAEYEEQTKANEVETAEKEQDVKYKSQEFAARDKETAEAKTDREGVQKELDAVQKVLKSLHAQCDETVTPYEEMKRRREAEIQGLKAALDILEGEAVLLQRKNHRVRLHRA